MFVQQTITKYFKKVDVHQNIDILAEALQACKYIQKVSECPLINGQPTPGKYINAVTGRVTDKTPGVSY